MTSGEWRALLERWSVEWLAALDDVELEQLPAEAVERRWLGADPARVEEIAAAEARLGATLPPSYRAFLEASNGWLPAEPMLGRLLSVAELDWFRAQNGDWIEAWTEPYADEGGPPPGSESHDLPHTLQVSDIADASVLLLDPLVIGPNGEWEAWRFANWIPGADRHRSFAALLQAEYERFVSSRRRPTPGAKAQNAVVKRTREQALGGAVESPTAVLVDAAALGHRLARILLVQLLAFQHRWEEVIPQVAAVLRVPWEGPGNAFWEDLCPALARAAAETGGWRAAHRAIDGSVDPKLRKHHRTFGDRFLKDVRKRGGVEARFPDISNERFDAAVARARAVAHRSPDEAWAILLGAIPSWLPFRADQLAPTPLLTDPVLGPLLTGERARAVLSTPRGLGPDARR